MFIRTTIVGGQIIVIVIGIFVDDLLVAGNSVTEINKLREKLNERFILTAQGQLEYYLGVEILRLDENTWLLHHMVASSNCLCEEDSQYF